MYDFAGRRFTSGGYVTSGSSLFMDVRLGIQLPEPGKGVFPLYPGFHILSREKAASSFNEIIQNLDAPPDLRWTTGELTLLSLNLDPAEETWWSCIRFEEVYCIKVRKGLNRKN